MDRDNLISILNKKRDEALSNLATAPSEHAIVDKTYQTILDIISRYETTLTRLSEPEIYEVDYNCPARNGFIETVEKSV